MAQLIADKRDVDFVLHEQLKVEELAKASKFKDFKKKTVDLIVGEARNLAIKELLPTQKAGEDQGCSLENGQVRIPEAFHRAYSLYREGEWLAMTEDPEWGGQGMPNAVSFAAGDYLIGANYALNIFAGLTRGAGRLIEEFGSKEQKEIFLKNMYSGKWAGTMVLTEPEAGSDVGALSTSAVKNQDGTYSISGNKIFISGGEQDLTENIIHPVLARIEGAPKGTKGISLFIVPKIWVNADGSLGEPNDIVCTAIEEKMGLHGSPTCQLSFGSKGKCRGLLLGEENKGMREMFKMMNEARLLVGMQGFGCASSAYLYALDYAKQRVQGRHLLKAGDREAPGVPIIEHPDVRRMLMEMKVYVEGMRSLLYHIGYLEDLKRIFLDDKEQDRLQGIIDVLIPIAKGYVTDRSFEICSQALQVFGGYGYIKDYPVEQLLRESRITMIYEGTNGIQAMDLLGRKLGMNNGQAFMGLLDEMGRTLEQAKGMEKIEALARDFEQAVDRLKECAVAIGKMAWSEKVLQGFAHASGFMQATGDLVMAWMLLWRGKIAAEKLQGKVKKKEEYFYKGQIQSLEYFVRNILPLSLARMEVAKVGNGATVQIEEQSFGS